MDSFFWVQISLSLVLSDGTNQTKDPHLENCFLLFKLKENQNIKEGNI